MKFQFNKLIPSIQLFLAEVILLLLIWLWNDYMARFLTLLISCLCAAILIISLIAEALERSRVPRFYFVAMIITMITPILVAGLMVGFGLSTWTFDEPLLQK